MTIDDASFPIELAGNEAASAFAALMPLDAEMSELHSNEKHAHLSTSLPADAANPGTIDSGYLMLYGSDCPVVF